MRWFDLAQLFIIHAGSKSEKRSKIGKQIQFGKSLKGMYGVTRPVRNSFCEKTRPGKNREKMDGFYLFK